MNKSVKWVPTGETRPPCAGEWFRDGGLPVQARFDFTVQSFEILRMEVSEVAEVPCGN